MAAIWAILVLAFINGNFVDGDLFVSGDVDHQLTQKNCPEVAARLIDRMRDAVSPDTQFVAKCVDVAALPITVSVFGSKPKTATP